MLASQFAHESTLSDGGETNETTAQVSMSISHIVFEVVAPCEFDLHTGNTSTSNIETG